ncbi:uncharacterized protein LOC110278755 [Arachis duranensis]|uniref:Uncharacterized protein LOC110278755 n=1 Tax=Arachis duranensis TaxID=130453 RepID=A0A6P5NC25_ARADU|nr:uncharacterized protein LOC110278755 [Arachis duranensis]
MEMAKDIIEGTEKEHYGKLHNYLSELLKANLGSTCTMSTHPQPEGLPKFRIVGQDANNHLFPIAYTVVNAETKKNWKWFLHLLYEDIRDYKEFGWNFMNDEQKGLVPALQEVMPRVSHRFCVMHMWQNLNKRWKDKELKGALWQCARAMTDLKFKNAMTYVKRINVGAWEYLSSYEQSSWSKSGFSEWPKVDNVTNNNAESFNATIVGIRGKSILTMLEEMRVTVNTLERTCTYKKWQLTELSCCHGVAAIQRKNHRPEDYVHHWLCMEHYNRAYQFHINSVPSEEYWVDYEGYPCLPPPYKRPIGRPTKKRAHHEFERQGNSQYKMPRKYGQTTCNWCKKQGHNARTCEEKKKSLKGQTSEAAETAFGSAN